MWFKFKNNVVKLFNWVTSKDRGQLTQGDGNVVGRDASIAIKGDGNSISQETHWHESIKPSLSPKEVEELKRFHKCMEEGEGGIVVVSCNYSPEFLAIRNYKLVEPENGHPDYYNLTEAGMTYCRGIDA